jgi:hypothetical protein
MGIGCIDPRFLDLGTTYLDLGTSCRFTPDERAPGTHWIGGWVDSTAGLDDMEKLKFLTLPGLELRPLLFRPQYIVVIPIYIYTEKNYNLIRLHRISSANVKYFSG